MEANQTDQPFLKETLTKELCGTYFVNMTERLDGHCQKVKGHEGEHRAVFMYVL